MRKELKGTKKKALKWSGPKVGQKRIIKRFAWLPQVVSGGSYIWLEKYLSYEEFCSNFDETKWKVWKKEAIGTKS